MIIRPVAMSDLAELRKIAVESGPGFTSLVADQDFLGHKIERSVASFSAPVERAGDQAYLFVLVAPETGEIMGTAGIEASVGSRRPLYHYRLGLSGGQQTLTLGRHYRGCSEICTLYLRPRFRRAWAGKLLSRVRFLFMAQHPQRFASTVIAEMRGVSDQAGHAPFWSWLQAQFVGLDFATASRMVGTGDHGFIARRLPAQPLDTHRMDDAARSVLGKVHADTRPALAMLESEGFRFNGLIDPLDGGPTVEAQIHNLQSVRQSLRCRLSIGQQRTPDLAEWTNRGPSTTLMVANRKTANFRATVTGAARYLPAHQLLEVPQSLAQSLGLEDGSEVWFADLEAGRRQQPEPTANRSSNIIKEALNAH